MDMNYGVRFFQPTSTNVNVASMDAKPYCVDCHKGMAHMRMMPISTRTVAND